MDKAAAVTNFITHDCSDIDGFFWFIITLVAIKTCFVLIIN